MAEPNQKLDLEVATPTGLALRVTVESVTAPSVRGEFNVLPGHVPILAALKAGVMRYVIDGKDNLAAVGAGFVEARPDKMLLLTDQFARPKDVNVERVKKELAELEEKIKTHEDPLAAAYAELRRDAEWCEAQILVAELAAAA